MSAVSDREDVRAFILEYSSFYLCSRRAHNLVKGLSVEHGNPGRCGRTDQRAEVTGARLCTKFGRRLVEREERVKRWKITLFEWDLQEGELRQGKVEGGQLDSVIGSSYGTFYTTSLHSNESKCKRNKAELNG